LPARRPDVKIQAGLKFIQCLICSKGKGYTNRSTQPPQVVVGKGRRKSSVGIGKAKFLGESVHFLFRWTRAMLPFLWEGAKKPYFKPFSGIKQER
jgi:hypothetical protein